MKKELIRIFTAFPLPEEVSEKFRVYTEAFRDIQGLRWTRIQNLHITIFFIGEIEEVNLSALSEKIKPLLNAWKSFELKFEKMTFRGKAHAPGMIWAQYEKNADFALASGEIQSTVKEFMTIEVQHADPIPHVTLARIKKGAEISRVREKQFNPGASLFVDHAELWKTVQTREGVYYERIPL